MEYDFLVVGGGSAGYAAARTAAEHGLRVAIVEGGREVGGLCILRGCMPSKTLLESARRFRVLKRAGEFGLACDNPRFDASAIMARKRRLVGEFADYRKGQLESGKFDFFRGRAEFLTGNDVRIFSVDGTSTTLRAKCFLIATGSKISRPSISGLEACLTSDDMLDLESIPKSIIVLGAGPVALEMASYCRAFGSDVAIVQRSAQILSGSDPDAASALEEGMRADGIAIHTGTKLVRVEKESDAMRVVFEKNGATITLRAERVLNALGRTPALDGLEALDLERNAGRLRVDAAQSTSLPHVFAAGDVCGGLEVVHVAIQQGETAAKNAAYRLGHYAGQPPAMDYRLKLFAVFSDPQFASVGATEAELDEAGIPFFTATYPFNDHGKSLLMGEQHGFVKLTALRATGEILGGSAVGPDAAELIHEVVVAMRYHATAKDFAAIPHYHPTLSEIWTYPAEEIAERVVTAP
jgi:pyruvate/2-oxoglutarate dehydrogenase complex dihydrolipoamide dehydrogenase (E3) component